MLNRTVALLAVENNWRILHLDMALAARKIVSRVLTPGFVVSLIYYLRYRAKISPKSEIELSDNFTMGPAALSALIQR